MDKMKKIILYAGMLLLIILGILIDNQRNIFRGYSYSSSTLNMFYALFDIFSNMVFITLIAGLTYMVFQNLTPLFAAIFFTLMGILFLTSFSFYLIGLPLPESFNSFIGPPSFYTHLSGAYWLFVGTFNIVKYCKQRAGRAKRMVMD